MLQWFLPVRGSLHLTLPAPVRPMHRNPYAPHILVVNHDPDFVAVTVEALEDLGLEGTGVTSMDEALKVANERDVSLVLAGAVRLSDAWWTELQRLIAAVSPAPVGLLTSQPLAEGSARQHG